MTGGLRIGGRFETTRAVTLTVDGAPVQACEGESLAAALLAAGVRTLSFSPRAGAPRGAFCHSGVCQQCRVDVDGTPRLACRVSVSDGMTVRLGAPPA